MRKIEISKTNKKTAIVCYTLPITLDAKNIRSSSLLYLRDYILNILGREQCDFISMPDKYGRQLNCTTGVSNTDVSDSVFKDIREFASGVLDINYYDEVFIYNSSSNAFGGAIKPVTIPTIQALIKFNGDIWYILTDPAIPPVNISLFVIQKSKFCDVPNHVKVDHGVCTEFTDDIVKHFTDKVFKRTKVAFCGLDYEQYYNNYHNDTRADTRKILDIDWAYFGLIEYYTLLDCFKLDLQTGSKDSNAYDFMYCGNKRNCFSRSKILSDIVSLKDIKCATVGYRDKLINANADSIAYLPHREMLKLMNNKAISTIITGDNLHNGNIITARFYESMLLNCVAFIWHTYDSEKKFVQNQELKDFIYVSSVGELHDKILQVKQNKDLFNRIVQLERKEVLNMFELPDGQHIDDKIVLDALHNKIEAKSKSEIAD